jgi:hypothetical protein
MLCALLALLLAAAQPQASPSPSAPATPAAEPAQGPVLLFLVDNSASLPPLDPEGKRSEALERMFTFLDGQPYRLVLFGGRREIFVDDVSRYRNNGQWTDLYFAFVRARELMAEYPKGTEFRIVMLTDAIVDPDPKDWQDINLPAGADLRAFSARKTVELVGELQVPLYVVLVGDPPKEGVAPGDREQSPQLILELVQAANGGRASPTAQTLAAFFRDDGLLLRKFVYRVAPHEGLARLAPIVQRIARPASAGVELKLLSASVVPLVLFLCLLLGILVRSFPGPGDLEIVELQKGVAVHLAVDRFHKVQAGGWGTTGLSLVGDAKEAAATLSYQPPPLDLSGAGLDMSGLDDTTRRLLPLGIEELKKTIFEMQTGGSKDEKISLLNLDYMAKNLGAGEAERILTLTASERRSVPALDFLRAKAHLLNDDALRERLVAPRVHLTGYGKDAERRDLLPGTRVRIGRYGFVVGEVTRGGRKDVRLNLFYDRVPSVLGLKSLLPAAFQRTFRMRASAHRVVS